MRVNVNLNENLLSQVDELAKRLNVSRSAFISICCSKEILRKEIEESKNADRP